MIDWNRFTRDEDGQVVPRTYAGLTRFCADCGEDLHGNFPFGTLCGFCEEDRAQQEKEAVEREVRNA